MTPPPAEIHRLSKDLAVCHRYDPSVKADLFSTAITTAAGLLLVDPIWLEASDLDAFGNTALFSAIIVTNENHVRASAEIADRLSAPVLLGAQASAVSPDVEAISIPGAPAGEVALHCSRSGGTLVIGDALINFGAHGFTFLPVKYCTDAKLMRKSLRKLLDYDFERIVFAHGDPITTGARRRLQTLLESES